MSDEFLEGLTVDSPFVIFYINYPPPKTFSFDFFFFCVKPGLKGNMSRLNFLLISLAFVKRLHVGLSHILLKEVELKTLIEE